MFRIELLLGAGIAFLGVAIGAYLYGHHAGVISQKASYEALQAKYNEQGNQLAEAVNKANQKARIVYRTKIRTIHEAKDTTGCADKIIPTDILGQLQ